MKTPFLIAVTLSPPNNVAKRFVDVYFSRGERGEYVHQGKRLVIFMCLNNFCHVDCRSEDTSLRERQRS